MAKSSWLTRERDRQRRLQRQGSPQTIRGIRTAKPTGGDVK